MATCAACGTDNPQGFKFCGSCGAALIGGCPSCGYANPPGFKFCGQCGTALAVAPSAPTLFGDTPRDERKLASVLFADVVGFTSLAESTDPETVARMADAAFRRMGDVVTEHGGTVDKYMGDCLMAVFGVPQSHDDDAERAIAAGLAMRSLGGDLAFSIGINSGEVMVASVGRDGDVTVMGDTVNVAARLEKAAGAGEVLVGRVTAELAGRRVVLREREPVVLKGKRDPVEVWEAVALQRDGDGQSTDRPPLVGREDDLTFLLSQWRRVQRDRRTGVVLLTGDAGVGKTRLLDELGAHLETKARVLRTAYPGYGGMGGPRVAADIMQQIGPADDPDVDARVRSITGDIDVSLRSLDPEAIEQEQVWAFRRLIEEKAFERPLLVVIDDVHRSGDKMLELLGALMARVIDVPVLLVLSGRPEPGEWLGRFPSATTLRLTPLGRADARALVDFLSCGATLEREVIDAVVERSAGNALYLRELVNVVREADGSVGTLPPTLRAVLAARLDALTSPEKTAIQHLAVLGEPALPWQVEALGLAAAAAALTALTAAGLARQTEEGCYDIVDPLLREVAYETLPHQARGQRHRLASEVASTEVDRARHLDRATGYLPDDTDLAAQAAAALAAAGVELLDVHRESDGTRLLLRAMELGHREPDALLMLAKGLANRGQNEATDVLEKLEGMDLSPAQDAERAHIDAVRRTWSDPAGAAAALEGCARRWEEIGEVVKQAWALSNRGVALFNLGRMPESSEALETALALFESGDDLHGRLATSSFLGLIHPEDPRVPDWLGDALHHAEEVGDRTNQVGTLTLLAWHHLFRSYGGGPGDIAETIAYAERLGGLARELGFAEMEAHGVCIHASLARFTGQFDLAATLVQRIGELELPARTGVGYLGRAVEWALGLAGIGAAPSGAPPLVDVPDPVAWMGWVAQMEALVLAGRVEEAMRAMTEQTDYPVLGVLDGILTGLPLGLSFVLLGRHAEAREQLERALHAAVAVRALPSAIAASALLAESACATGDTDEARRLLDAHPAPDPGGISEILVLRARAALGETGAGDALAAAAERLRAPGLLTGLSGTSAS